MYRIYLTILKLSSVLKIYFDSFIFALDILCSTKKDFKKSPEEKKRERFKVYDKTSQLSLW